MKIIESHLDINDYINYQFYRMHDTIGGKYRKKDKERM